MTKTKTIDIDLGGGCSASFKPLKVREYPLILTLLETPDLSLDTLPESTLDELLNLTMIKCTGDNSLFTEQPLSLLTATYNYVKHHIDQVVTSERLQSLDEQKEAVKGEPTHQEKLKKKQEQRHLNRQIKQISEVLGKHEFSLLTWASGIVNAESKVTGKTVEELLDLGWDEFITIANKHQALQNIIEVQREQERQKAELANKKPTQPMPRGM